MKVRACRDLGQRMSGLRVGRGLVEGLERRVLLSGAVAHASTFLPSGSNYGSVYDAGRNELDVSMDGGIAQYNATTGAYIGAIATGGQPGQGDITTDGNTLYVTDRASQVIYKVDLTTNTSTTLSYAGMIGVGGSSGSLVIVSNSLAYFSGSDNESYGALYTIDLQTDSIGEVTSGVLSNLPGGVLLQRSGDRGTMLVAEKWQDGTPLFTYDTVINVQVGSVTPSYGGNENDDFYLNQDGSLIVGSNRVTTTVWNRELLPVRQTLPTGVGTFSADGSTLYLLQSDTNTLVAYNTGNWSIRSEFTPADASGYQLAITEAYPSMLAVTANGSRLFVTMGGTVEALWLDGSGKSASMTPSTMTVFNGGVVTGAPTFVPSGDQDGIIYDPTRNVLNVSMDGGIAQYNASTGSYIGAIDTGGWPGFGDITVDGHYLYVVDRDVYVIHKVDLATGTSVDLNYVAGGAEANPSSLVIVSDTLAYFSSGQRGSGNGFALRTIDLSTDTFGQVTSGVLSYLSPGSWLLRSGDRHTMLIAEVQTDGSPLITYDTVNNVELGSITPSYGAFESYDFSLNEDGSMIVGADESSSSTTVWDRSLNLLQDLPGGTATFSPDGSSLYLIQSGTSTLTAYRTSDFTTVGTYDVGETYAYGYGAAANTGFMAVTANDGRLFVTTNSGVRMVWLDGSGDKLLLAVGAAGIVPAPTGGVTGQTGLTVSGWAFDEGLGSAPASVVVTIDGVVTATIVANEASVAEDGALGSADHGFSYALPTTLTTGSHVIVFSVTGSGGTTVIDTMTVAATAFGAGVKATAKGTAIVVAAGVSPGSVKLAGPGAGEVLITPFGTGLSVMGTTKASTLTLTAAGAGMLLLSAILVGDPASNGDVTSLGKLVATTTKLVGTMTVMGSLSSLSLGQVQESAIVVNAGGGAMLALAAVLPLVTDLKLVVPAGIASLSVGAWGRVGANAAEIDAPYVTKVVGVEPKGLFNTTLSVDIHLTGSGNTHPTLGTVSLGKVSIGAGTWDVAGNVQTISATKSAGWTLDAGSGSIQTIQMTDKAAPSEMQVIAGSLKSLTVGAGGIANSHFVLVGALSAKGEDIGTFSVAGAVVNTVITSAGSVGTLKVWSLDNTVVHVGTTSGAADLPVSAAEFVSVDGVYASIGTLTLTGAKGGASLMNGSDVAAGQLKKVSLGKTTPVLAGNDSGVMDGFVTVVATKGYVGPVSTGVYQDPVDGVVV